MTRPIFARGIGTSPAGPAGADGKDGADGLPGVNAVANDTATAAYINTPSSATATALSDSNDQALARSKIGGPRRVAAIGDSTAAGYGGLDYVPGGSEDTATSWLMLGVLASGGRLEYAGNFGVPGETSAQVKARVGTVVTAAPDVCVILCGRNDAAPTDTLTNIADMVTTLRAAAITPVLATLCPTNGDTTGGQIADQARIRATNRLIREYARVNDLAVCEFFNALAEPSKGFYKDGVYQDPVHPNRIGFPLMVAPFLAAVDVPAGGQVYRRAENTLGGGEIVTNGLMLTSSGGVPTGWDYNANGGADVATIVTNDARFFGNAWQVVTPAGSTPNLYLVQTINGLIGGKTYEASFKVAVSGVVEANNGHLSVELVRGSGQVIRRFRFHSNAVGTFTFRFVCDHTTLFLAPHVQNGSVAADLTHRFGEVSVRQVD